MGRTTRASLTALAVIAVGAPDGTQLDSSRMRRDVVSARDARDSVRDMGKGNRVTGPAPPRDSTETGQSIVAERIADTLTTGAPTAGDTLEYVVLLGGRPRGEQRVITQGDTVLVRLQQAPAPARQAVYRLGANGSLRAVEVRGLSAAGQATQVSERFEIMDGTARWQSSVDSGSARADRLTFYQSTTDFSYGTALLANFLLRQPNRTASLFPAGEARARMAADISLLVGGMRQRLRLVLIEGVALESKSVWLDERGALVATGADNWFVTVRRGAEDILPILRAIDLDHRARAAELLAQRLAPPPSSAVVIRNGDLFDSERGVILPHTTVVLRGERIVAVGPNDSVAVPSGARVIDATGKTVLPGLWDMHTHQKTGMDAVLMLATGVTTMRSLGAEIDVMISHRERTAKGVVISPRVMLAGFMDGPGERRGVPTDALVATEEEARRWVARYDSLGYRQIKLYDSVHPFLIAAIAEEAHKRGMRLSGHLPRGISVPAAVHLGFDEIHHVMHLVSTFFPDSVFIPRERAPAGVALAVARSFDVDAPRVTELLALLRERGTVIDGTFNLEQDLLNESLPDGTHPVFGTTLEMAPAARQAGDSTPLPSRKGACPACRDADVSPASQAAVRRRRHHRAGHRQLAACLPRRARDLRARRHSRA